jgi:ribulose-phosphate 3-epimerase
MVARPERLLEALIALRPHLVIIHLESEGDITAMIKQLHAGDIQVGLAIKPETPVTQAAEFLPTIEHLLIFTGGHIGHFGGDFRADCLAKVKQAQAINDQLEIAVDGGINLQTGRQAVDAGVDILDCGSFIHNALDPEAAYRSLQTIVGAPA